MPPSPKFATNLNGCNNITPQVNYIPYFLKPQYFPKLEVNFLYFFCLENEHSTSLFFLCHGHPGHYCKIWEMEDGGTHFKVLRNNGKTVNIIDHFILLTRLHSPIYMLLLKLITCFWRILPCTVSDAKRVGCFAGVIIDTFPLTISPPCPPTVI